MLAIDFGQLLSHVVRDIDPDRVKTFKQEYKVFADLGIMQRLKGAGEVFYRLSLEEGREKEYFEALKNHVSDIARAWACFMMLANTKLTLNQRFKLIQPFAADEHMNVKECAWFALRPYIIEDFEKSLPLLEKWVNHRDPNIRRCAIEGTRPRGVWTQHFELLKDKPQKALSLLTPCLSDESRYVQNALANWLNDASKSQPEWVTKLCGKWSTKSKTRETAYIVKRALRTIK